MRGYKPVDLPKDTGLTQMRRWTSWFTTMLAVCGTLHFVQPALSRGNPEGPAICDPPEDVESLSGLWSDTNAIAVTKEHQGSTQHFYDLKFDSHGRVEGVKTWRKKRHAKIQGYDVSGKRTYEDSERVIGIFEKSDCSLILAETTSEEGLFRGSLVQGGLIRFAFVQAGESDPMVVRGWLSRDGSP